MKSARLGKPTSGVEVTNVSTNGVWLLLDRPKLFLAFEQFPWFEHATIGQIAAVERPSGHHLYWPELDIDLAVESIHKPEAYPLVSKVERCTRSQPAVSNPGRKARSGRDKASVGRG